MDAGRFRSALGRFFNDVEYVERLFITTFTLAAGVLILYEIVIRGMGIQGLKWIDEFGRIMLIITTLIGSSIAVRHRGHMIMDVVQNMLSPRHAALLRSFTYVLSGLFYLFLTYYSYGWTMRLMRLNRTMDTINLPIYIVWIFVTFAICTMGLRYLVAAVQEATREPQEQPLIE